MVDSDAEFDVVSVRVTDPKDNVLVIDPGSDYFRVRGTTLAFLVQYAFGLLPYQIKGMPGWASSTRFDITAKMDNASNRLNADDRLLLEKRLQRLLVERFGLQTHESQKAGPIFEMVVAKGGLKLKPASDSGDYVVGPGLINVSKITLDDFAAIISEPCGRKVVNMTQVSGEWGVQLKWAFENLRQNDESLPGLVTALRELGIALISKQGSVRELSIDSIHLPSPN